MWKITLFFSYFNATWTETYYQSGLVSFSSLLTQLQQLAIQRTALNAAGCILQAIRIVNLNQPRLSSFMTPGTFASQPGYQLPGTPLPDAASAPPFVAVQVKWYGLSGNVARRYLSGAPEEIIGGNQNLRQLDLDGRWINALSALANTLAIYGFSFRFTNQAGSQLCQNVTTNAQFPGEIGVQFGVQMIAPVAGQIIRLRLKGFKKVNYRQFGLGGVYQVDPKSPGITAAAAPFIYYLQNTGNVQVANIATLGVGVQLAFGFDGFSNSTGPAGAGYSILSANHRKRGGSALLLRGRSKSKP